ncbi:hypothetical protein KAR91_84735 [Candidatus Pacearchaeota archaeon]|nr:hypothetical protein [Candidatus Pacearchaeota archaeon]
MTFIVKTIYMQLLFLTGMGFVIYAINPLAALVSVGTMAVVFSLLMSYNT